MRKIFIICIFIILQPGDMLETNADIKHTTETLLCKPRASIEYGIKIFVDWFNEYYGE